MKYYFYDAEGYRWCYDSKEERVYNTEAEFEMSPIPGSFDNGYGAPSLEVAIKLLMEDGYMEVNK